MLDNLEHPRGRVAPASVACVEVRAIAGVVFESD
jgi:hypothetical protein